MNWATERQKDSIKILNELGMNDGDISYIMRMSRMGIRRVREKLNLSSNTEYTKWSNDRRKKTSKLTFLKNNINGNYLSEHNRIAAAKLGWPYIPLSQAIILETLRRLKNKEYNTAELFNFVNQVRVHIGKKKASRTTIVKRLVILHNLGFLKTIQSPQRGNPRIHYKTELIDHCWGNIDAILEIYKNDKK